MEKKYKELYITEVFIIVLYLLLKVFVLNRYFFLLRYFDFVFYLFVFIYFYLKYGFPREKNYLTRISVRYIIIALLSYVLIIYGLGLFMGFTKSIYDTSIFGIIKNIFPIVLAILFKEFIRYSVAYNSKKNIKPIIFLTIIFIFIDFVNGLYGASFTSFYQVFRFICLTILPSICKQLFLSYLSYNINFIPAIIYSLVFEIAPFVLPIYPDLGDYLNAVIALVFPFFVFSTIKKIVNYNEKTVIKVRSFFVKLMVISVTLFLGVVILLVSGLFNYKMIAIGSDSMNPVYYRGDAVIYEKVEPSKIENGDILVFEYNHAVITHRVINIIEKNDVIFFETKGDNNTKADLELTSEEDVLGKVKYIVKYIGYPTIFINEKF